MKKRNAFFTVRLSVFFIFLIYNMKALAQNASFLVVGTYTQGKSNGIYVYDFKEGKARLRDSVVSSNPSYLAVSPDNRILYAVNENDTGTLSSFLIDSKGKLAFQNQEPTRYTRHNKKPDHPCYVSVHPTGRFVAAGNYSSGTASFYEVQPGSGPVVKGEIIFKGSGSHPSRQEAPHVHATVFSPDGKYLLITDLGRDRIITYELNGEMLQLKDSFVAEKGSGPRHLDFHPNGRWVYLINELNGTVNTLEFQNGRIYRRQTISLLPKKFSGEAHSADIHVSPDGRFLYATNRHPTNHLGIFAIDRKRGTLVLVGYQSTMGKAPRNFSFDPTGDYLLVANQDSDNIVVFKVDHGTGLLTDTETRIEVGSPVCLKWISK
jgi:6-phosphogluconolactonase